MTVGEAFLSAFLQVLFDRLASREFVELLRGRKLDEVLEKLKITLLMITAVLNDAEEKQFSSPAVEKWLHMAKDALYDAEDVLDELATDALQSKLEGESQNGKNPVRNRSFIPTSVNLFKEGIESKIKKIIDKLESISKQKDVLGLKDNVAGSLSEIKHRLPTTSLVEKSCVYGRDDDEKLIIEGLLRDEPSNAKVGVVPIVGMGGIGKTILAQLVYNNGRVEKRFALRIWVCVTDQFDVMRITKTLVESITSKTPEVNDLNLLQVSLRDKVVGHRFLLVLDDVWSKRNKGWDLLLNPLRAGAPGSKIIVTTRNADVASSIGTVPAHHLKGLSFEDCWSLFKSQAFEDRNIDAHPNLEVIGREIVKKCDGLPLAAKRLGVLLRTRVEEHEWRDILNKKIWDLPDDEREILQTLRLSYDHLPAHLKQCFAYCAIFPKDYEFKKDSLVLLWIAEGFVQQPKGNKRLEEAGGEYFQDLVSRSFFQQSSNDKSCFVMHDFMKDLAQFVSRDICFRLEDMLKDGNPCKVFEKASHSSYIRGKRDVLTKFEAFNGLECLRSFLPLDPMGKTGVSYLANKVPSDLLPKLRCLRVLSFNGYRITELPDSIGNLRHLRYLDLSHTAIKYLPESASTLYNLQALILLQCHSLSMLPTNMGNLTNLRHLCISETRLKMMPLQMHRLTSLQTLSHFVVGKNGGSGIGDLRNMSHLQGKLLMTGLQNVASFWDAAEAKLKDKHEIDELVFQWSNNFDDLTNDRVEEEVFEKINVRGHRVTRFPSFREVMQAYEQEHDETPSEQSGNLDDSRHGRVDTDVLEMLQPHNNIKQLVIKDYRGTRFPGWIGNASYSNIIRLKLSNCKKCKCLPSLGQLPSLKYLTIKGMEGIKMVGTEFYKDGCSSVVPFPSLETLKFENMLEWEVWSSSGLEDQEDFHHLQKIEIKDCPKLKKFSHHFPSLEKMSILRCQQLETLLTVPTLDDSTEQGGYFPCLLELSIRACPNLRELPNLFPSLAILDIDGCLELAALPRLPLIRELELMKCGEGVLQSVAKFTSLTYLHLSHISEIEFLPEGFFHHLTALEELQISHFCRLTTLSNEIGLQNLPYLKRLKISACPCLEELPQNLHSLVSLIELKVWKCPHLVSFPESGFPSMLRILEIKDCEPLESLPEWIMHNNDGNNKNTMSHLLEYFVIEGCSTLKCLPRGKLPSTLKKLEIQNCMNLDSLPEDMTSVQFLKISACSIVSFPKGGLHTVPSSNFMKLKQLIINKCMKLESLPEGLHNLMYLEHLEIAECPLLFSFPGPGLPTTKLRTLKISNCINFKSLPNRIYNLTSLQELCIDGCCSLASLPEGGLPNSLILLSILDCKNLKPSYDWGLHRLTSLNHFSFGGCPDLMSLPEEWLLPTTISSVHLQWLPRLKSLPRGLQKLKSLEKLEIWECGNLLTLPEEGQSKMQWNLQFWDVL